VAELLNAAPWVYTELDTVGTGVLSANNVTFTGIDADGEASIKIDRGVPKWGNGLGDFDLLFEWSITADGGAKADIMQLNNDGLDARNTGAAWFLQYSGGAITLDDVAGSFGTAIPANVGSLYFCRLFWVDATSILTYEQYTSAAARTTGTGATTLTMDVGAGGGDQGPWRWLNAFSNDNRNQVRGKTFDGTIQNIDFQEGPPIFVTATLQDSTGAALADGTVIYEYDTASGALKGTGAVDSVATGVAGGVSFQHSFGDASSYYLTTKPDDANLPIGGSGQRETVATGPISRL